ncbi:MAG: ADP-glyceromanno-heptose 6-epimerase [Bacteroidetes bacterium]|nr:ADP-glyceromanno-heptose 6-epimerase [Bacteroidota bacterium]
MIIVTGAAGFIGSCLAGELNRMGFQDLVLVDHFTSAEKMKNLEGKKYRCLVPRDQFFDWISGKESDVEFIFHIGARTNTAEQNLELLHELNVAYSQNIWKLCCRAQIPLIYASSAATFGMGKEGFSDEPSLLSSLLPMNPYGRSKQEFDLWVMEQKEQPFFWAGFKFFNVFGPNEYHKGRMASVVFHAFRQIRETGRVKLFRSHREGIADGDQKRDFIYVKDVLRVMLHFMQHRKNSGLYNLGTGNARSFRDLALAVFQSLDTKPEIDFIDTPEDIRDTYQYFTQADTKRLIAAGYHSGFTALETAVDDYVRHYLNDVSYL